MANRAGDNFDKVQSKVEDRFRSGKIMFDASDQTRVNIFNEPFFPRPKGHMQRIKISLLDSNNITFEFSLARRNTLKTLKDIALNAVISNVRSRLLMKKMEVPETLKMTLRKEFYNDWARKRFPSYNITVSPHAESLKRKREILRMEEKESKHRKSYSGTKLKNTNLSLHRVESDNESDSEIDSDSDSERVSEPEGERVSEPDGESQSISAGDGQSASSKNEEEDDEEGNDGEEEDSKISSPYDKKSEREEEEDYYYSDSSSAGDVESEDEEEDSKISSPCDKKSEREEEEDYYYSDSSSACDVESEDEEEDWLLPL